MKSRRRLMWAGSVALVAVLVGSGCSPAADSNQGEKGCAADKSFSPGADSYADVGKPGDAKGTGNPFVVILEEQHALRTGQVEMAIMLNRLFHTAGLRHLALEGSVVGQPQPNLSWFTALPDAGIRQQVALQMLKEGEVSAAEFAAMVLPGFQLHAIEKEQDYQVGLSAESQRAYTGYLTAIAAMTMTIDQLGTANDLLGQEKFEEAIQFIIDTSPWTSQRNRLLDRKVPVVTSAEMRNLGVELEAKAQQVGADVAEYREDFRAAQAFFEVSTRRSTTMASNTVDIAAAQVDECAPIAMNIGAAHTVEVTESFGKGNVPYAVISPLALLSEDRVGSLSGAEYDRKLNGKSVDSVGSVGAFLDGRRKPRPVTGQDWFKAKAQLSYATIVIARAAAAAGGGDQPPYGLDQASLGLGGSGPEAPKIAIDPSSVKLVRVGGRTDAIFKVTQLNGGSDLWVKTAVVAPASEFRPDDSQSLELALKEILVEVKKDVAAESGDPLVKAKVVEVGVGVKAAVARTEADVEAVNVG